MSTEAVPQGYKRTEVGVIPEDWESIQLSNVCLMKSGAGITSESIDKHSDYPCFGGNGIRGYTSQFTHDGTYSLIGRQGALCGNVVLAKGKFFASEHAVVVTPRSTTDIEWLSILLSQMNLNQYSESSAQPGLSVQKLLMLPIPCPTKGEQQAIATALSDADALIESLEQLLAKKRQIKQGAMQELLTGKRRLPGFSGKWETKQLGELADVKDGTHQTPTYVENGIPFYSVENVTNGDFINTKFISESAHRLLTKNFKIEKGDILMTRIGSIGDCKLIDWDVDASFYVSLALLKIRGGVFSEYLCHYSRSGAFQKEAELHSLQYAIPKKINLGPISNILISAPIDNDEQSAIATVLSDMDAELKELEAKLSKARQVKQGMMQQLLTGKIRLVGSGAQQTEVPSVAAPTSMPVATSHNPVFNEAVLISVLAGRYGTPQFPLSRFRYTKFLYLFHRHVDHVAQGFKKKAAGPYNPDNRYKGEPIALKSQYVKRSGSGLVAGPKNADALGYFEKWFPLDHLLWLDRFRYEKNDALEVLTTVDMACEDLRAGGKPVTVQNVKALIESEPEWLPKLERDVFSDTGIAAAIRRSQELFGEVSA